MPISKETIKELCQILKEDYGIETSEEESESIARSFVGYFDLINKIDYE